MQAHSIHLDPKIKLATFILKKIGEKENLKDFFLTIYEMLEKKKLKKIKSKIH